MSIRAYEVSVNADLVDTLNPSIDEWNSVHKLLHMILELEWYCTVTGCLRSAVTGRETYKLKDFLS